MNYFYLKRVTSSFKAWLLLLLSSLPPKVPLLSSIPFFNLSMISASFATNSDAILQKNLGEGFCKVEMNIRDYSKVENKLEGIQHLPKSKENKQHLTQIQIENK
jgi:hypothetical protein